MFKSKEQRKKKERGKHFREKEIIFLIKIISFNQICQIVKLNN